MNQTKTFFLSILLMISIFASFKMYKSEQTQLQLKSDLIELSHVEYGLLNVDKWERLLADIIANKLGDFKTDEIGNDEMKENVSVLLKTLIDDYEENGSKEKF